MNELWYKFKFAVQEDLEKLTEKRTPHHAADVLNETIKEAEQQTAAVGKLMDRQRLLRDEITKELAEAERMAAKRKEQLQLAEATEDDELISYAADEVHAYERRRDELQALADETTQSMLKLERRFENMKHKVKDMKVRRLKLMGEENENRANYRMDRIFNADLTPRNEFDSDKDDHTPGDIASMRQRLDKLTADEAGRTEIV
ncbi:PspA/IM30 family protein [Sporosarcina trichiuri]|uniref:PspA/IM30 family protein n=1 Tax=Sporosarcina trichiuri TaxID=3056445 RepID=UPI0025B5755A|nr:PspA/IM30 family protein [Sporosarcina sp. 0.2-SM1T-5]WJY26648.1 PspA/IM30 family protein [Sporosarcina sp. 0.2-SM1T-5]